MNKQTGSSLLEVIIVVGIMGIISMAMASMIVAQQTEMKALYQKSEAVELKTHVVTTFLRASVCTWQLAGKVVDLSTTTTAVKSPTVIDFGATPLYEGLDASSSIIARAGALLPFSLNGIMVSSIRFKDILATGVPNQYKGTFEIQFLGSSLVRSMKPIQIQQTFLANNATATAQIQYCGAALSACPANFILVGSPEEMSSFCIDTNQRGNTDWASAQAACIGILSPGSGRARLCTSSEWKTACNYGTGITNIGPAFEWVAESYSADNAGFVVGNPTCNVQTPAATNTDVSNYRCCIGK